jgi:hypothetical protein
MYFLNGVKINLRYFLLVGIAGYILMNVLASLILYLATISNWWVQLDSMDLVEDAANYMEALINIAVLGFIFFVTKLKKLEGIETLLIHALVIALVINIVRMGFNGTFGRLATYFTVSLCVLIPNICNYIPNKDIRLACEIGIVALYAYAFGGSMNYGYTW